MEFKEINDYVDEVHEKFPYIPKEEIIKILKYGFKTYYDLNNFGADTLFINGRNPKMVVYTGQFFATIGQTYNYWKFKWSTKLRILFNRRKTQWDGYYYAVMTDRQYEDYLEQFEPKSHKKRGKVTRKKVIIRPLIAYKLEEEAIKCSNASYIFRIKYPVDMGFKIYKKEYETTCAELIKRRVANGYESINDPK